MSENVNSTSKTLAVGHTHTSNNAKLVNIDPPAGSERETGRTYIANGPGNFVFH